MDVIQYTRTLESGLLECLQDVQTLQVVKEEKYIEYVRLEPSNFVVTAEDASKCKALFTAHNIQDYIVHTKSIKLETTNDTWLAKLIGGDCFDAAQVF